MAEDVLRYMIHGRHVSRPFGEKFIRAMTITADMPLIKTRSFRQRFGGNRRKIQIKRLKGSADNYEDLPAAGDLSFICDKHMFCSEPRDC